MPPSNLVRLDLYKYAGEAREAPNESSVPIPVPNGANAAIIMAEGGAIYFAINNGPAKTTSGGYAPQDSTPGVVYPIDDFRILHVYGGAGAIAHVLFYKTE